MANQPLDIILAPLGALGTASGTFQSSAYGVTAERVEAGAAIIGNESAYQTTQAAPLDGVACMDDRLNGALRLAGGGVSLALMKNFIFGGEQLSEDLRWLRDHGFYVLLHDDCGALAKLMAIVNRLTDVNAAGYQLLEADGVAVEMNLREEISKWATRLHVDYADVAAAKEVANEVQPVVGDHVAGYLALIERPGVTLGAAADIEAVSGLKSFVITTWAADEAAGVMTADATTQRRAGILAKLFSAETVLVLGGPELVTALLKR